MQRRWVGAEVEVEEEEDVVVVEEDSEEAEVEVEDSTEEAVGVVGDLIEVEEDSEAEEEAVVDDSNCNCCKAIFSSHFFRPFLSFVRWNEGLERRNCPKIYLR